MSSNVSDAILERIRKCLALANGKNATQGEMEAAMGKAKEMALRYGVELASINIAAGKDAGAGLTTDRKDTTLRSQREQRYHRFIYNVFQVVFGVRTITSTKWVEGQGRQAVCYFVGESNDVAICLELFPWLEDVFYSTYYRAMKEGKVYSCAAHKNGIYFGLSQGIIAANKREEAKLDTQDSKTWALVRVSKEALVTKRVEEEFPDLRKAKQSRVQVNNQAYAIGHAKGKTVNLNQVGSNSNATKQLN